MTRFAVPLVIAGLALTPSAGCDGSYPGGSASTRATFDTTVPEPSDDRRPADPTDPQPPATPTDPTDPTANAEPLPEYPKADPNSKVTPLNPEKTLFLEVLPDNKGRRVAFVAEVCLRDGPLEVLICKQGTKEHEAVVRVDLDAKLIHAALEAAGAKAGTPTKFVDPVTNELDYKPATGTPINLLVHYRMDGKLHTRPGREWVWNNQKKEVLGTDWVFAGSELIPYPDQPDDPPFYAANSGEFVSISNFFYSMLELPVEISKDDANLFYEANTKLIPPLGSKVWVILEPKKSEKE